MKVYNDSLLELSKIVENYENRAGREDTEMPKKVEIFQLIRKVSNIYLKTNEILSCLETNTVLRDDYNKGLRVSFLSKLKEEIDNFFENSDIQEESEKYLRTLTGERGVGIGNFSLNKYAVNNFKEISIIEEKLVDLKTDYDDKKQKKFEELQIREDAYWEAWNEIVNTNKDFSILKNQCPEKGKQKDLYKNKKIDELEDKHKNPKTYRFGPSTVEVLEDALLKKFGYWNGKVENSEM